MRIKGSIRRLMVILACGTMLLSAGLVRGEVVSQKQAMKIAETFFNASYGQYVSAPKLVWNGRQLTTDRLFSPFYVYNHPLGGFVIISADSKAFPILGYSRTSKFDRDRMTEEEKELLSRYAHEIELIRYDPRIPERAVGAWQNMALTINKVLENPYDTPEYEKLSEEAREKLEQTDRRNNSIMMPSAIEFDDIYYSTHWRRATLDDVLGEAEEEEIPFKFYEDFIAEIAHEEQMRLAALDEVISPTKPVVSMLGGGHFSVRFPEDIRMARLYSMQGRAMSEKYFRNTDTANLDISSFPTGFYALMVLSENGKVYGLKLYR